MKMSTSTIPSRSSRWLVLAVLAAALPLAACPEPAPSSAMFTLVTADDREIDGRFVVVDDDLEIELETEILYRPRLVAEPAVAQEGWIVQAGGVEMAADLLDESTVRVLVEGDELIVWFPEAGLEPRLMCEIALTLVATALVGDDAIVTGGHYGGSEDSAGGRYGSRATYGGGRHGSQATLGGGRYGSRATYGGGTFRGRGTPLTAEDTRFTQDEVTRSPGRYGSPAMYGAGRLGAQ